MTSADIRRQARQTLNKLDGTTKLFLIPIILFILNTWTGIKVNGLLPSDMTETAISSEPGSLVQFVATDIFEFEGTRSLFSWLLGILLIFFLTSATLTMLKVVRREQVEVDFSDSLLAGVGNFLPRFVLTEVVKHIFLFLWGYLPILVASVLVFFALFSETSGALVLIIIALYAFGLTMLIIKSYAYSMTSYILFDQMQSDSYVGPRQVIKASSQLMQGQKVNYFVLDLTFIGWNILTSITAGLLAFYVMPYRQTADAIFYQHISGGKVDWEQESQEFPAADQISQD